MVRVLTIGFHFTSLLNDFRNMLEFDASVIVIVFNYGMPCKNFARVLLMAAAADYGSPPSSLRFMMHWPARRRWQVDAINFSISQIL